MNDQAPVKPVIVVLPAEIDVTNSDEVYEQLLGAVTAGTGIVIADMTLTSFCDSSGVHAIMRAYDRATARDTELRLAVSPEGSVRRVLELTGAVRLMPIHPSVEEAAQLA
jgi:anti-sigma B factor antagonist